MKFKIKVEGDSVSFTNKKNGIEIVTKMYNGQYKCMIFDRDGCKTSRLFDSYSEMFRFAVDNINLIESPGQLTPFFISASESNTDLSFLTDIAFVDDQSERNYARALVTPFIRLYVEDTIPMVVIDGPRASGKSLLAQTIEYIATGESAACTPFPSNENCVVTMVNGIVHDNTPVVVFDNVKYSMNSEYFSVFLASNRWSMRDLGSNTETVHVPRTLFIVTGHDIKFSEDIARRTAMVRLTGNGFTNFDKFEIKKTIDKMVEKWMKNPHKGSWLSLTNEVLGYE